MSARNATQASHLHGELDRLGSIACGLFHVASFAVILARMSLAHASKGKVIRIQGDLIVFKPGSSTYELHLKCPGYAGPMNESVDLVIRGVARKAYTVPSGGLFVSPIMGTPRILQGRVTDLTEDQITLNCGVVFNITLSKEDGGLEMAQGPITANSLVNVVLMPGASAELWGSR